MIEANDILSRKSKIEGFIETDDLMSAVKNYIDLIKECGSNSKDAILLSRRYHEIRNDEVGKEATKEQISVIKTTLSKNLLSSLQDFSDDALTELLNRDTDKCRVLINENLEEGFKLLLDISNIFASEDIEKEILGLQKFVEGNTDNLLKTKFLDYIDLIVKGYSLNKVENRFFKKKANKESLQETPIPNDLVLVGDNLIKNYNRSNFHLKAYNIELRLGEITGLVGENATGKTTLLKILAGELAPDKGAVNYPLFDPKGRKDWTDLKMRIAYVPQELTPWEGALLENLAFEAARHGIKGQKNKDAVDYIIERLGLSLHTDKTWAELSGGYKLRFALAKALIWQPQLLILDEPLAYLDIKTQSIVLSDLRNLAKSLKNPLACLISSQHLHETESVADQMWFMRDGVLENLGSTKDFNRERDYNLFELSCSLSFLQFEQQLAELKTQNPKLKTWASDQIYFIKTPLSISPDNLIDYCQTKGIKLQYFRNISQSVKTKFYDDSLV